MFANLQDFLLKLEILVGEDVYHISVFNGPNYTL